MTELRQIDSLDIFLTLIVNKSVHKDLWCKHVISGHDDNTTGWVTWQRNAVHAYNTSHQSTVHNNTSKVLALSSVLKVKIIK